MASSSSSTNFITLQSSDLKPFTVAESVAIQSETIKQMIKAGCASDPIPLLKADSKTLGRVITYFEKHAKESVSQDERKAFDAKLIDVSCNELFDLIVAADYLNVPSLLSLVIKKVAILNEGKSHLWIRQMLNIKKSGYTKEEEAAVLSRLLGF